MNLPYVYKLTHKETNQFYIGYRSANRVKSEFDLGFKYFSSSKIIKKISHMKRLWYFDIISAAPKSLSILSILQSNRYYLDLTQNRKMDRI